MTIQTGKYTDVRDGTVYKTVLMPDNKWWFAENFKYSIGGVAYGGNYANVPEYGELYSQSHAITETPTGCHLPTQPEYINLINLLGGLNSTTSASLRSTTLWTHPGNNSSGFNVKPGGFFYYAMGTYNAIGSEAVFMTATGNPGNYTLARIALYDDGTFATSATNGNDYWSVRYIVDSGNVPDAMFNVNVNDNGTWKTPKEIWLNQNGVWVKVKEVYTSNGSTWKKS